VEDRKIKSIVEKGLYQKAPVGMMDRIMANLVVNPARRLSIKPVEPKPIIAILLPILIVFTLVLGLIAQPQSMFPHTWDLSINIYINPVWAAPILVTALSVWVYIIIVNKKTSKT